MKAILPIRTVSILFLLFLLSQGVSGQNSAFKNYEGTWISDQFGLMFEQGSVMYTGNMTNTISGNGNILIISESIPEKGSRTITITDNGNGNITAIDDIISLESNSVSKYNVKVLSDETGSKLKLKKIYDDSDSKDYESDAIEFSYSSVDNTASILEDVSDVGGYFYNSASSVINPYPGVTIEQRLYEGQTGMTEPRCAWWQVIKFKQGNSVSTSSTSSTSGLSADEKELLDAHNFYRAEVNSDPLIWSDELSAFAKAWAEHCAQSNCQFEHRPREGEWIQKYGENIWMGSFLSLKGAVESWGSEKSKYDGGVMNDDNWQQIGHYTQIIWSKTTKVGCGYAKCSNGNYIVVCNYDPPGNYQGESPLKK